MNRNENKRITWRDLEELRLRSNLTNKQLADVFGIPEVNWNTARKKKLDQEIKDPSVAILFRLYSEYPETIPAPQNPPDMRLFYDELCVLAPESVKIRHLGVLLGKNHSAGYAWVRNSKPASETVYRMVEALQRRTTGMYETLMSLATIEMRVRGVDALKTGKWKKE